MVVGWILSEQRGAAKPCYPLAAGHETASNLSNHVYWIQGVLLRKLSIGDGKLGEDVFGVNPVTLNSIVRLSVDLKSTTICKPSWVNYRYDWPPNINIRDVVYSFGNNK